MALIRKSGSHAGEYAEVHRYSDGSARIVISLDVLDAEQIASAASGAGGRIPLKIEFAGRKTTAYAVEARIDTVSSGGEKLSGPGVIGFEKLKVR